MNIVLVLTTVIFVVTALSVALTAWRSGISQLFQAQPGISTDQVISCLQVPHELLKYAIQECDLELADQMAQRLGRKLKTRELRAMLSNRFLAADFYELPFSVFAGFWLSAFPFDPYKFNIKDARKLYRFMAWYVRNAYWTSERFRKAKSLRILLENSFVPEGLWINLGVICCFLGKAVSKADFRKIAHLVIYYARPAKASLLMQIYLERNIKSAELSRSFEIWQPVDFNEAFQILEVLRKSAVPKPEREKISKILNEKFLAGRATLADRNEALEQLSRFI